MRAMVPEKPGRPLAEALPAWIWTKKTPKAFGAVFSYLQPRVWQMPRGLGQVWTRWTVTVAFGRSK